MIERLRSLGADVVVLAVLVAVGATFVVYRESQRDASEQVREARRAISVSQAAIEQFESSERLPYLEDVWLATRNFMEMCGVEFSVLDASDVQPVYSGSAPSWEGAIGGPSADVLACALMAHERFPFLVDEIRIEPSDEVATLRFTVVGHLDETRRLTRKQEVEL